MTGIAVSVLLLAVEHRMIKPSSRRRMQLASYNLNQVISLTILLFTLADQFCSDKNSLRLPARILGLDGIQREFRVYCPAFKIAKP